jgi:hypothetical protein
MLTMVMLASSGFFMTTALIFSCIHLHLLSALVGHHQFSGQVVVLTGLS